MKKSILCLIIVGMLSPQVFAHGVEDTEAAVADHARPPTLLERLISSAEAKASVRIDKQGGYRYIESDGLADHQTGRFPNAGNPHQIQLQHYQFRVSLNPRKRAAATPIGHAVFGVAINGVPFDPGTAEFWQNNPASGWTLEALTGGRDLGLDSSNAHVQPNGAYHYHSVPLGILNRYSFKTKPVLLGYAADGFPIYSQYGYRVASDQSSGMVKLRSSYQLKTGMRPSGPSGRYDGKYAKDYEYIAGQGDLDQCNGRTGVMPEYPQGVYYYVLTDQFPYIPRCLMGSADTSFQKQRRQQGGGNPSRHERGRHGGAMHSPPQEAFNACGGKSVGAACSFSAPHGTVRGACRQMGPDFVCVPRRR